MKRFYVIRGLPPYKERKANYMSRAKQLAHFASILNAGKKS